MSVISDALRQTRDQATHVPGTADQRLTNVGVRLDGHPPIPSTGEQPGTGHTRITPASRPTSRRWTFTAAISMVSIALVLMFPTSTIESDASSPSPAIAHMPRNALLQDTADSPGAHSRQPHNDDLSVTAIMLGDNARVAVVNGRIITVGDTIAGARVMEIAASTVRFDVDGTTLNVGLSGKQPLSNSSGDSHPRQERR